MRVSSTGSASPTVYYQSTGAASNLPPVNWCRKQYPAATVQMPSQLHVATPPLPSPSSPPSVSCCCHSLPRPYLVPLLPHSLPSAARSSPAVHSLSSSASLSLPHSPPFSPPYSLLLSRCQLHPPAVAHTPRTNHAATLSTSHIHTPMHNAGKIASFARLRVCVAYPIHHPSAPALIANPLPHYALTYSHNPPTHFLPRRDFFQRFYPIHPLHTGRHFDTTPPRPPANFTRGAHATLLSEPPVPWRVFLSVVGGRVLPPLTHLGQGE